MMSTAAMIFTPIFAIAGLGSAYGIGRRLKGQGWWRLIGVMACLSMALNAADTAKGLFG